MDNKRKRVEEKEKDTSPSEMQNNLPTAETMPSEDSTLDMGNELPPHKKKRWGADEDGKLAQLVEKEKSLTRINWSEISHQMENRSAKQCRERYINSLKPDAKKGQWTAEEDDNIIRMQAIFGNQWSKISSCG